MHNFLPFQLVHISNLATLLLTFYGAIIYTILCCSSSAKSPQHKKSKYRPESTSQDKTAPTKSRSRGSEKNEELNKTLSKTNQDNQLFEEEVKFERPADQNMVPPSRALQSVSTASTASSPSSGSNEGYHLEPSFTQLTKDSSSSRISDEKNHGNPSQGKLSDPKKLERVETLEAIDIVDIKPSLNELKTKSKKEIVEEKYIPVQERVKNELGKHKQHKKLKGYEKVMRPKIKSSRKHKSTSSQSRIKPEENISPLHSPTKQLSASSEHQQNQAKDDGIRLTPASDLASTV